MTPVTASAPMAAIRMPRRPDIIPFGRLSPLTPAIREIPRIAMEKYSTEANLETSFVIKEAQTRRSRAEKRPPKVDANREVSRAFFTFPFFASGYPSKVVAIAEFVPGVFSVMALIEPPYIPPT